MLSYMMILVHTIRDSLLNKYSIDLNIVVIGFKNKINQLCKSLGLLEKCHEVVNIAQFFQAQQKQSGGTRQESSKVACSTYFKFQNMPKMNEI